MPQVSYTYFVATSFKDVYNLERFPHWQSYCLFAVFSSFTKLFFLSNIQKMKSFSIHQRMIKEATMLRMMKEATMIDISFFLTRYYFYTPLYGESSCDMLFVADIQKFHNQRYLSFFLLSIFKRVPTKPSVKS